MHSAGEYVLFIDDDVIPTSNLIHEHVLTHNEHGSDIVALGPMCTPEDFAMSAWVRWEQAMLLKQYNSMQSGHWKPTARQFYTGNTSLRRSHLLASGGFDHTFRRAEDVELAYRLKNAGLKFIFNPKAIGYHYAERSFNSWMETPYAYGRNDVIFTRDKDQSWLLPTVFEEFHNRNILIQKLVRVCLDRHKVSEYAVSLLRFFSRHSDYLGLERIVQMAHSGLFNLQYYQGISDELGGRISFFEQVQR